MFRSIIAATAFAALSIVTASTASAQAQFEGPAVQSQADVPAASDADSQERLLIVNRNSGRVIYDDHRNDLFCVTRSYVLGYTYWGRPIYGRNMRCR